MNVGLVAEWGIKNSISHSLVFLERHATSVAAAMISDCRSSRCTARAMAAPLASSANICQARSRMVSAEAVCEYIRNKLKLGLIYRARCWITLCRVRAKGGKRAGFFKWHLHTLSEIEINEGLLPVGATLILVLGDAIIQKAQPINERLRLRPEVRIKSAEVRPAVLPTPAPPSPPARNASPAAFRARRNYSLSAVPLSVLGKYNDRYLFLDVTTIAI